MWPTLIVILMSAVCTAGDCCLKLASGQSTPLWNRWTLLGSVLLLSTNFAWIHVMGHLKLATIGAVFAVSTTLLLALSGFVFFQERLSVSEIGGLILAVLSIVLLGRFTG